MTYPSTACTDLAAIPFEDYGYLGNTIKCTGPGEGYQFNYPPNVSGAPSASMTQPQYYCTKFRTTGNMVSVVVLELAVHSITVAGQICFNFSHPDGVADLCCRQNRPSPTGLLQTSSAQMTSATLSKLYRTLGIMLALPHTMPFRVLWPQIVEDVEMLCSSSSSSCGKNRVGTMVLC